MSRDELVDRILSFTDSERRIFLAEQHDQLLPEVIELLKARGDEHLLRDPRQSLHVAEIAQEVALLIADDLALAMALWAKGNALLYLGEYRDCLECYRQAQTSYAQRAKSLEVARLQVNQIASLRHLAEYTEALRVAEEARATLTPLGPTRYLATLEMNIGEVHRQKGEYELALAAYVRGREIFSALGSATQAARMDVNRSIVLEYLDQFDEAEQLLESARVALVADEMAQEVARVDLNLGVLAFRQGRYQLALRWLEQARDGFVTLKNKLEIAGVDLYRSNVYLALNLLPEALELASQAERVFARRGMKRQVALATINEGAAHRQLGEELAAMRCFARAKRIFQKRGANVEVALLDTERAALLRAAGSASSARRMAEKAAATLKSRGLIAWRAQANLLVAECALDLTRTTLAESLAREALQVADELKLAMLAYRAQHVLGRVAEQRGQVQEAYTAYRAAVEAVETLCTALHVDEFRVGFLADKLIVYEDAVRLALVLERLDEAFELMEYDKVATLVGLSSDELPRQAADDADRRLLEELGALRRTWHWTHNKIEGSGDALSEADRERSAGVEQALRDQLSTLEGQIAELERRWQVRRPQPDPAVPGPVRPLGEVQKHLDADAALVQYFVVRGRLVALVVRADSAVCVTDLATLSALERQLDSWRFSLESLRLYPSQAIQANLDNFCADAQAHLTRFHKALIAPLESHLDGCRRIFVVPQLILPDVPFGALYDGQSYLVERYEIVHLPMASLMDRQPELLSSSGHPFVIGYSDRGRLRFAVAEAQRVAAVLAQKQSPVLRVEDEATEAEFRARTRQCNVLHLATHSAFRPDNPFFSWVRLVDARVTVTDLYGMELPGRPLVTLSACETALGGQRGGGLIGLGRSLLAAGASALVVSLWKVEDDSTAQFMEGFYRGLLSEQSLSSALRSAQLEMLRHYRHPFYWASFILVQGQLTSHMSANDSD